MKDKIYKEFLKAKKLLESQKNNEANEILWKILISNPSDSLIKIVLADSLANTIDTYNEAEILYKQLLQTDKKYDAIMGLAKLEVRIGNYDLASNYYEQLLQINSNNYYALLELVRLKQNLGYNDEARNYLKELLQTDYKCPAILELGKLELNLGNYSLARSYFTKLINPKYRIKAYEKLMYIEIHEENYTKALDYLEKIYSADGIKEFKYKRVKLFIEKKLGIVNLPIVKLKYFESQVLNYNPKMAIIHIKNHEQSEHSHEFSIFYDNIDTESLFYEISLKIQNMVPVTREVLDRYLIDFSYPIGISGNTETSKVEVITFPSTKAIISIYPTASFYRPITSEKQKIYSMDK